ncbi:polysaccharide pyruvyl transferase family protein [Echinicola sp. CAU 1574]|uniref:Polysaccharide pyruvyl transferase family protein n=1 Tax=Echinicola arenosa TaxID=2774144 RepID=A0ABR9AML0_9BACT|nr:polysaccharide pyruvyl transferase family protein [Echinicola arenosa]MBD8490036.1 polysaccharide pyruvyl transferase family protein [Echinicola arenosa]
MENILIIGAFDRYNYGDLLFPIIIEKQMETYRKGFRFRFFGLVESDLSHEGGKPTESLAAFYAACEAQNEGNIHVIVAGGEALGVTWHSLWAALNPTYQKIHRYRYRLSQYVDLNKLAKRFLKGKTTLPFLFAKEDFNNVQSVILNSLGGSGIKKAFFEQYPFAKSKLMNVDYLAVRDQLTVDNLAENNLKAALLPDSAVLMSKFFPNEELVQKVTSEVRSYVQENRGDYLFFQINKKNSEGKEKIIADQLDEIYQKTNTKLCLCPIGKALDHDDHLALAAVKDFLRSPHDYFDADNIWDIMYLIANSKAYAGTSLHGAITAMSYAVPHVGLVVEKLDAYLNTWGVEGNQCAVPFEQLYEQFKVVTEIAHERYHEKQQWQISLMEEAFDRMVDLVSQKKEEV